MAKYRRLTRLHLMGMKQYLDQRNKPGTRANRLTFQQENRLVRMAILQMDKIAALEEELASREKANVEALLALARWDERWFRLKAAGDNLRDVAAIAWEQGYIPPAIQRRCGMLVEEWRRESGS